jgi:hypothetical protein
MAASFDDIDGYGTAKSAQSIRVQLGGLHRAHVIVIGARLNKGNSSQEIMFTAEKPREFEKHFF